MTAVPSHSPSARPAIAVGFREFVCLVAALMAINALGIDSMLPALPAIGRSLGIEQENQRQWIISGYMFGFGAAQLIFGPLADRFGRKPVLIVSMVFFAITSFIVTLATNFETILIARVLQGIAAASARVLSISIVRDVYSGRQMARVMSLCFIVFLAVPILAPSIGQLIMLVTPWQGIFHALAIYALILVAWTSWRLPETLHAEDRRRINPGEIWNAAKLVLSNRVSLGYTIAQTLMFGSLLGFINSVQQIFADIFHAASYFTIIFAGIAGFMGLSAFTNSRIVEAVGTRKVSHSALIGFIAVAAVHVGFAASGHESLVSFALFQALTMFCFGMAGSNFGSMAMEPVGHIAGTASSIQGFISTIGGALLGAVIGQSYNGTTLPVASGYLVLGLLAIGTILVTERGQLFHARIVTSPRVP